MDLLLCEVYSVQFKQFKVTEITDTSSGTGTRAPAAKSISRKQPIISLSNSVLVLDYKRTRVRVESNRQDIYQEGDIIVITKNPTHY